MTKIWHKSYDVGVPTEININQYTSINEVIEVSLKKYRDRPAWHCMGTTMTYGQLDELSKKFASDLQNDLKLQRGDRVALMMPNILQYPVALYGVLRAGLTVVNVNPLYTARELEHQMKDSGAKAIVIFANSAGILQKVLAKTDIKHVLLSLCTELASQTSLMKNTM